MQNDITRYKNKTCKFIEMVVFPKTKYTVSIVALFCLFYVAWNIGAFYYVNLDFHPINGDFQTYNPIRRFFLGDIPFKDFNSYLGFGPPGIIAPMTKLMGSDFGASRFASYFVCIISFFIIIFVLFKNVGLSVHYSILFASFHVFIVLNLGPVWLQDNPIVSAYLQRCSYILWPVNSLLGLRCLLPYITALVFIAVSKSNPSVFENKNIFTALFFGLLAGPQILWSNDYGFVSAFVIFIVWVCFRSNMRTFNKFLLSLFIFIISAIVAFCVVCAILTQGNTIEWFQYNLTGVAKEQFWYFGFSEQKVVEWKGLPIDRYILLSLIIVPLLFYRISLKWNLNEFVLMYIYLTSLFAGFLSTIGGGGGYYFFNFYLVSSFIVGYLAFQFLAKNFRERSFGISEEILISFKPRIRRFSIGIKIFFVSATFTFLIILANNFSKTIWAKQGLWGAPNGTSIEVPELGGHLSLPFDKAVAIGRELRDLREDSKENFLFSTYASAMDVLSETTHPTPNDYIIHALGDKQRSIYLEKFHKRPVFVTTIREDFVEWEPWIRRVNWYFYRELFRLYRPVDRTFYNILWKEKEWDGLPAGPHPVVTATVKQIDSHSAEIAVSLQDVGDGFANGEMHFAEIEIAYDTQWKPLWWLKGGLRKYVWAVFPDGGRVGLPPAPSGGWRLPVEVESGKTAKVMIRTIPEDLVELDIIDCRANYVCPKREIDQFPLMRLRAASLSDSNWKNGIWNREGPLFGEAGFFVTDASDLRDLQPGLKLHFAASGMRVVDKVNGDQVWVTGGPLEPEKDGYPHLIRVVASSE